MPQLKKIKGRYEIKAKLGEGGMGVVYKAYDPPPMNRDVALKTLRESPDRVSFQLFYKECEVLKDLTHPNIVKIYDIGEFDDNGQKKPFFVMPLLPGKNLEELIRTESHRLRVERVVEIISQTCRGLQAAHDKGLVHRDLKPSNLFVMEDDSVTIIDFGLAHIIDSRSRSSGFQMGTLLYMAPEQVRYKPVTPQSDIFSLGVVCYEALTRRQPFRRSTEQEVVQAIEAFVPPSASEINPAVNQVISQVVHKAMAKKSLHRFDTVREFGECLKKAVLNQPIELFDIARIQPRIERAKKALNNGDYQFAGDIVGELEAEGHIDPQITLLRTQIDQVVRQRTIAQLLESARARYEEEEDPLALQKIQEILELDPDHAAALAMKGKIEDRRSERQIENWFSLANQHVKNHLYDHAREALQNVLKIRQKESRALRLLKDIENEEKEYFRLRNEKGRLYQAALNAWKNGDISEALSGMERVLKLDDKAPDASSPESSGTYRSFYNKVRSDHDAINNGYAEARRHLAEQAFDKAVKVCQDFLTKYPGQALFQALKLEIEEQEGQRRSSYIAEVNRRLETEADLDAKINLLREALTLYPNEGHFDRSLKMIRDKRELVEGIIAKARLHEKREQFSEALSDLDTLRTIYSSYPGLPYEIERLQKRKEDQVLKEAKAGWVEQIERELRDCDYDVALGLVQKALEGFPGDSELLELQLGARQGSDRAGQAAQLLSEGQNLCGRGDFESGLAMLKKAYQLDERNSSIRISLRDVLVERTRATVDSNWQDALTLCDQALELDPNDLLAKSLRIQALDRGRDEFVSHCVAEVRRMRAEGKLESAFEEVNKGLKSYPSDPRLTTLKESLKQELGRSASESDRLRNLKQLRELKGQAETATDNQELDGILNRSRALAGCHPDEPDVQSLAREVDRIIHARGDRAVTPYPRPGVEANRAADAEGPNRKLPRALEALAEKLNPFWKGRRWMWGLGVIGLVLAAISIHHYLPKPGKDNSVSVQIRTDPEGARIQINGNGVVVSGQGVNLKPGEYKIEASLPGYETATSELSVKPGTTAAVDLRLLPMAQVMRIAAPDLVAAEVRLDDNPVGNLVGGTISFSNLSLGNHVLKVSAPLPSREDTTITFLTAPGNMPTVAPILETHQLQAVAVSTKPGAAHIVSSLGSVAVTVDGKPAGQLGSDGMEIGSLEKGVHELILGQGKSLRKMSFEIGLTPAIDAILYSDRDVGSVLVLTGEDNVDVLLDGRKYVRQTQHGELRIPNLKTTKHTVGVVKDGFAIPNAQQIDIVKGQEARVTFSLLPTPKLANLAIDGLNPGIQVSVDDQAIGTIGPDGALVQPGISPGNHTIHFTLQDQTKGISRDFAAGETVRLSAADVDLKRVQGTLDVVVTGNTSVTISRGNQLIRQFTGSRKLELDEGSYTIGVRAPGGQSISQTPVSVAVGESRTIDLRTVTKPLPSIRGMELWDHSESWKSQDQWSTYRGAGFVLYNAPQGPGDFTFTAQLHRGHNPFSSGPRLKWVVSFVDEKNYVLLQMDDRNFYRTEFINGDKQEFPKVALNIPPEAASASLRIEVSNDTLVHRYSLPGDALWKILNSWDRKDSPSSNKGKTRSFVDGKFGFYLQGNEEIYLSHFTFIARPER
jgi:serine/threonine protein kinase